MPSSSETNGLSHWISTNGQVIRSVAGVNSSTRFRPPRKEAPDRPYPSDPADARVQIICTCSPASCRRCQISCHRSWGPISLDLLLQLRRFHLGDHSVTPLKTYSESSTTTMCPPPPPRRSGRAYSTPLSSPRLTFFCIRRVLLQLFWGGPVGDVVGTTAHAFVYANRKRRTAQAGSRGMAVILSLVPAQMGP